MSEVKAKRKYVKKNPDVVIVNLTPEARLLARETKVWLDSFNAFLIKNGVKSVRKDLGASWSKYSKPIKTKRGNRMSLRDIQLQWVDEIRKANAIKAKFDYDYSNPDVEDFVAAIDADLTCSIGKQTKLFLKYLYNELVCEGLDISKEELTELWEDFYDEFKDRMTFIKIKRSFYDELLSDVNVKRSENKISARIPPKKAQKFLAALYKEIKANGVGLNKAELESMWSYYYDKYKNKYAYAQIKKNFADEFQDDLPKGKGLAGRASAAKLLRKGKGLAGAALPKYVY